MVRLGELWGAHQTNVDPDRLIRADEGMLVAVDAYLERDLRWRMEDMLLFGLEVGSDMIDQALLAERLYA